MASQMFFTVSSTTVPVTPVAGREITISGPGVSATVVTNGSGQVTYTYSFTGAQLPAGTYTLTLVTDADEEIYDNPLAYPHSGNPITWVCTGPAQASPSFAYRFLQSFLIRLFVSADCSGSPSVSGEGAEVTLDGTTVIVGADSYAEFTTFGGTINLSSAAFADYTFQSGVVNPNPSFSSLPYSVDVGIALDPRSPVGGNLFFLPPGGCGTGAVGSGGTGVCNLHTPFGHFLRAWIASGALLVRRADAVVPPFALANVTAESSGASHPDFYRDETQRGRTYLLYQKSSNSYRRYSDDDGATWSEAELAFTGGKYPRGAVCPVTGAIVEFAYVSGAVKGRRKYPGDSAFSAEFTVTGLGTVSNNTFGVSWAPDDQRRIVISVNNGTSINDFVSHDDGASFAAVP